MTVSRVCSTKAARFVYCIGNRAQVWNSDPDEDVALRVLAGAGLEESLEGRHASRAGAPPQAGAYINAHTTRAGPRQRP